jgi:AraC family transcriptional regulator of adaptative response/methylated-DNA-[protein]-cysteine methyltransferase
MNATLDLESSWAAVCARDAAADGSFVFAVSSTGVYCRPSCPARRPLRSNVSFFGTAAEAELAGYRACLRCRPREALSSAQRLAAAARELIDSQPDEQPRLTDLAQALAVSPSHLQRCFRQVLGATPRQYAAAQRLQRLKRSLRAETDVTTAIYAAGYGSASRVYAQTGSILGMTPAAYKRHGRALEIGFGSRQTSLGALLVAATSRGICFVAIADSDSEAEAALRREFSQAILSGPSTAVEGYLDAVENLVEGRASKSTPPLDLHGSEFQLLVWQALRQIPAGETRGYGTLAREIGRPGAARAVARACATNPAAVVVPCHRVVGADGGVGGYRWGVQRKQQLLKREAAGT